jgi:uncharacterized protein (UPF0297 family)
MFVGERAQSRLRRLERIDDLAELLLHYLSGKRGAVT